MFASQRKKYLQDPHLFFSEGNFNKIKQNMKTLSEISQKWSKNILYS